MKQLQKNPWESITERYPVEQLLKEKSPILLEAMVFLLKLSKELKG